MIPLNQQSHQLNYFFVLFELRTAQKLLDSRGQVDLINVVIEDNADMETVRVSIENIDKGALDVINAQEAAAEQADGIKQGLNFFNTILNVFAGIALFVGAFIIQNTFRILLLQRTKEPKYLPHIAKRIAELRGESEIGRAHV